MTGARQQGEGMTLSALEAKFQQHTQDGLIFVGLVDCVGSSPAPVRMPNTHARSPPPRPGTGTILDTAENMPLRSASGRSTGSLRMSPVAVLLMLLLLLLLLSALLLPPPA